MPSHKDENLAFGKLFTLSDGTGPWLRLPRLKEWKALSITHLWSSILVESGLGPQVFGYRNERVRSSVEEFRSDIATAKAFVDTLHRNGIRVWGYLAGTYFWGDPRQRDFFLNFYDKHWDEYKEVLGLGPKPSDPMGWVQIGPDGKPFFMHYQYGDVLMPHMAVSPYSPEWREYDKAVLRFLIKELDIDGIEVDEVYVGHAPAANPLGTVSFDRHTLERFRAFLKENFTVAQLKDVLGLGSLDQVNPTDSMGLAKQLSANGPLKFVWNDFQARTVADFLSELRDCAHRLKEGFEVATNNYAGNGNIYFQFQRLGINPEATIEATDYLRSEMIHQTFPRLLHGKKQSNSPLFKYLRSVAGDKPVVIINNRGSIDCSDLPLVYRAMVAEATANGVTLAVEYGADQFLSDYFTFLRQHQDLLVGSRPVGRVAVLCSMRQAYADRYTLALTVSRILSDHHILHRIILDRDLKRKALTDYSVLILPYVPLMTDREISDVTGFVRGGGRLVIIGRTAHLKELGMRREKPGFGEMLGTEWPETKREVEYHKGRALYIPCNEMPYFQIDPSLDPSTTFLELVDGIPSAVRGPNSSLLDGDLEGPSTVEYSLMRLRDGRLVVHMVNYGIGGGKLTPVDDMEVRVATGGKTPKKATLLSPDTPGERELEAITEKQNGEIYVRLKIPKIQIYALIAVQWRPA